MEHDVPECRVFVVSMRYPVFRVEMKLNIAENAPVAYEQFRVEKIRTVEFVPSPARDDRYTLPGIGIESIGAKFSAMPDFLKNAFGKGDGTEKPLDFRDARKVRW
jgi:hypothetical protein